MCINSRIGTKRSDHNIEVSALNSDHFRVSLYIHVVNLPSVKPWIVEHGELDRKRCIA